MKGTVFFPVHGETIVFLFLGRKDRCLQPQVLQHVTHGKGHGRQDIVQAGGRNRAQAEIQLAKFAMLGIAFDGFRCDGVEQEAGKGQPGLTMCLRCTSPHGGVQWAWTAPENEAHERNEIEIQGRGRRQGRVEHYPT